MTGYLRWLIAVALVAAVVWGAGLAFGGKAVELDLAITNSDDAQFVKPEGELEYKIEVSNAGPGAGDGARVTSDAVKGLTRTSITCEPGEGAECPETVTVTNLEDSGLVIPKLPKGGKVTLTIKGTASGPAKSDITAEVEVEPPAGAVDIDDDNNRAIDRDTIAQNVAELQLTHTNSVRVLRSGGGATYTLKVVNAGPDAADEAVVIAPSTSGLRRTAVTCAVDAMAECPARLAVESLEGDGLIIPKLPSGGSVTFSIAAVVEADGGNDVAADATVETSESVLDPDRANNAATDSDSVVLNAADVKVSVSNGATAVKVDDVIVHEVVVQNSGPDPADGVVVLVPAVDGLERTAVTCAVPPASPNGAELAGAQCPAEIPIDDLQGDGIAIPRLPAGTSVTLRITATVTATEGAIVGEVSATLPEGTEDPDLDSNHASDRDPITALVDLAVTGGSAAATVKPAAPVIFDFVVANRGQVSADGAIVIFPAAAGLIKTALECTVKKGDAVCPEAVALDELESNGAVIGKLPPGSELTFRLRATVEATEGNVIGEATVVPPGALTDPNPDNDRIQDSDQVTSVADLAVMLTDNAEYVRTGSETSYTITVTNQGPDAADGAAIISPEIAGIDRTEITCAASMGAVCPEEVRLGDLPEAGVSIPSLPPNGVVTLVVRGTVSAREVNVVSDARFAMPTGTIDLSPFDNEASDRSWATGTIDLAVTQSDGTDTVKPGTSTDYVVVVTNRGRVAADGATLTLPTADNLTRTAITCAVTAGTATCPETLDVEEVSKSGLVIPTFGAAATLTFTISTAVEATGDKVVSVATIDLPADMVDPETDNNMAEDSDLVTAVADLQLTNSDGVTLVKTGRTTDYVVALNNAGPDSSDGVTIRVPATSGLEKTAVVCEARGGAVCPEEASTSALEGDGMVIPTLPASGAITLRLTATVTASSGTVITEASVSMPPGTIDFQLDDNRVADKNSASSNADLQVVHSDQVATVKPNAEVRYTVEVSNAGPTAADGAVVALPAAEGLSRTAVTCAPTAGAACPTELGLELLESDGVTIPTLPVGGKAVFTVTATVTAADGEVKSEATATAPEGTTDPNGGNNRATDADVITAVADLAATVSDGIEIVRAGTTTTYTITITNSGPDPADGARVVSPEVTGIDRTTIACSAASGATCPEEPSLSALADAGVEIPTLPAGGSATLTVTGVVSAREAPLSHTVTVAPAAGTTDFALSNNRAVDQTTATSTVDLALSLTDGVDTVKPNTTTDYVVVITNRSRVPADGAVVVAPAADNLTRDSIACAVVTGTAACPETLEVSDLEGSGLTIPSLGAGATLRMTVRTSVAPTDQRVVSVFEVSPPAEMLDAAQADNRATDSDMVTAVADLRVAATDGQTLVKTGHTTSYQFTISNTGPDPADGALVKIPAVIGLEKTEVTCTANGDAVCPEEPSASALEGEGVTIPTFPSGGSVVLQVGATVSATGGTLTHEASVTTPYGTTDFKTTDNRGSDKNDASNAADLQLTHSDQVELVRSGADVVYSVEVRNAGPTSADGAIVVVPALEGLTKTRVTCAPTLGAVCPSDLAIEALEGDGLIVPTLPSGGKAIFTVTAKVSATEGALSSQATVTPPADTNDANLANNEAVDRDSVQTDSDLSATITTESTAVDSGAEVVFTIQVSNAGPEAAKEAVVVVPAVTGLTRTSLSCNEDSDANCPTVLDLNRLASGGLVIPSLGAGRGVTFTIVATAKATNGSLSSSVSVATAGSNTDPRADNNSASNQITVVPPPAPSESE